MRDTGMIAVLAVLLFVTPASIAQDDGLDFHEDYYLGFSQGAYYGLLLAGTEYDVAWCVKSELAYEAGNMGTGGNFQAKLEAIHKSCQASD